MTRFAINLRPAVPGDASVWQTMRRELWPEGADEHAREIALFFDGALGEPSEVILAETADGVILGLAELSIRTGVPGLEGHRTGYVEGLFVRPGVRHCGVARKLIHASRLWARRQGCGAFASDRAGRIVLDSRFVASEQSEAAAQLVS